MKVGGASPAGAARPVPVVFFVPNEPNLDRYRRMDPDTDWVHMKQQRRWTVQTYLRLSRAGHPVALSGEAPDDGLLVFHAGQRRELLRRMPNRSRAVLIAIRGDRRESPIADYEVLQNGKFADGRRRFFIPYWPQPGLIPRDPARGTNIARAAFKGFDRNLHPDLRSREWLRFLEARGIVWEADSIDHAASERGDLAVAWHDYREVDLVVAIRPRDLGRATSKPATKLYNAWHAGVPAILGPEYAFRELRRSELDYIEACSLADVRAAVDLLRGDPARYRAMVENGHRRAADFTVDVILDHWSTLLFETLAPVARLRAERPPRAFPLQLRALGRRVARLLSGRPAR